jgi:hypothetical protein
LIAPDKLFHCVLKFFRDLAEAVGARRELDQHKRNELVARLRPILPGSDQQLKAFTENVDLALALYFQWTTPVLAEASHRSTRLEKAQREADRFASAIERLDEDALDDVGEAYAERTHLQEGRPDARSAEVAAERAIRAVRAIEEIQAAAAVARSLSNVISMLLAAPSTPRKTRHRGRGQRVDEGIASLVQHIGAAYLAVFHEAPSAAKLGIFSTAVSAIFHAADIDVSLGEKKLNALLAAVRDLGPPPRRGRKKRPKAPPR